MSTLKVNGKERPYTKGMTVTSLLEKDLGITGKVVVEINGNIIQREYFATTELNKGDLVEIVHFVGGG